MGMHMRKFVFGLVALTSLLGAGSAGAAAPDCPNNGVIHLAAIPAEDTTRLAPILGRLGKLIAARLDCEVIVQFGTSYTAAIEAMRAHRAEVAMFGAFSYVLAHQVAGAPPRTERGRKHEEQQVAPRHERVGQTILAQCNLRLTGQCSLAQLAQHRDCEQVVRPQPRPPFGPEFTHARPHLLAAFELDRMPLAVFEPPPKMAELTPLAVFQVPPAIVAYSPLAVLLIPPPTVA